MTLAIILFLLATAVLALLTIPFAMLINELEDFWVNVKFWAVVVAAWVGVWFAVSWGKSV